MTDLFDHPDGSILHNPDDIVAGGSEVLCVLWSTHLF